MYNLKQLQSCFQDYLMNSNLETIHPMIAPDNRFSSDKRLRVYHDAYRIRLLEILKLDFSKTHTLMGDDEFEKAFHLYLSKHPSQHFSVRYFGQHFCEFLKTTPPYQDYPVLAEMALFEWNIAYTIDAENASHVSEEQLISFSPEEWATVQFKFHPSVISSYFHWDTPQLWQHIEAEGPERPPVRQEKPLRWLFWRQGIVSKYQSCSEAEDKMAASLFEGDNFAEICEKLLYTLSEDEIPIVAAQTLHKWVHEELITQII